MAVYVPHREHLDEERAWGSVEYVLATHSCPTPCPKAVIHPDILDEHMTDLHFLAHSVRNAHDVAIDLPTTRAKRSRRSGRGLHDRPCDIEAARLEQQARRKQIAIVGGVVVAATLAALIVSSAVRGPARQDARLGERGAEQASAKGYGDTGPGIGSLVPLPAATNESQSNNASSTASGGSTASETALANQAKGPSGSGSSTGGTSSPTSPAASSGPSEIEVVYTASGVMSFVNCGNGGPLCAGIDLKVGDTLSVKRDAAGGPETIVQLLESSGGMVPISGSGASVVFRAEKPVADGYIVVLSDDSPAPKLAIQFKVSA